MKKIIPLHFVITGKKRKSGDNRQLEVYLNVKDKEQQKATLDFLRKYLELEESKSHNLYSANNGDNNGKN